MNSLLDDRPYQMSPGDARFWLGLGLGAALGYVITQQLWGVWQLLHKDVHRTLATQTNQAPKSFVLKERYETPIFKMSHTIEDGIERIFYIPHNRRFQTPILMLHGMWLTSSAPHCLVHSRLLPEFSQG